MYISGKIGKATLKALNHHHVQRNQVAVIVRLPRIMAEELDAELKSGWTTDTLGSTLYLNGALIESYDGKEIQVLIDGDVVS